MQEPTPPVLRTPTPMPVAPSDQPMMSQPTAAVSMPAAEVPMPSVVQNAAPPVASTTEAPVKVEAAAAPPMFNNGMLVQQPPAATVEKKEETAPQAKKSKKMPTVVLLVVALVIIIGLGLTIFLVWQNYRGQVGVLKSTLTDREARIVSLENELTTAQDLMLVQQDLPVYVDTLGRFSFLQEIPGLKTTKTDETVTITYGEVNESTPVNGLVMTMEMRSVNGWTMANIATDLFEKTDENAQNFDFRTETFGDVIGYSFVNKNNEIEKFIYFLQKDVQSEEYIYVEYEIKALDQASYDNFEQIALEILGSIKIY